jgi:wobble nucleotide-excising tRNase
MITKIIKFQNVGLFRDGTQGRAIGFGPVTAIYAENGRGKSTFSAMMRACHLGDPGRVAARKTIDVQDPSEIELLFDKGQKSTFTSGAWSGTPMGFSVFDSEFVEQNVYSGFEVRPDQRQSLLEFALGDQSVKFKKQIDQLSQDMDVQARLRKQAEKLITGISSIASITAFIQLPIVADAQVQIDALQQRADAARRSEHLIVRRDPIQLSRFKLDLTTLFSVLATQISDVESTAETLVLTHLGKHSHHGADFHNWINSGHDFMGVDECPFCGGDLTGC